VEQGEEQEGVGAGPDGDVLVGPFGGRRTPGVDDDEPPAPGPEGLEPPRPVGGGGQAPVGFEGIGAEDEEVVGAVKTLGVPSALISGFR
jgi:hypothetical protein